MTSDSSLVTHCGWCCEGGAKQHLFRLRCLINDTLISSSFSLTHCFPRKTPRILPPPPPPPISSDESKYKRHICIFWGPWMNDFAPVAPATRFQENIHPGRFREISPDFRFRFRIRNPQHTSTTKPNPREREREKWRCPPLRIDSTFDQDICIRIPQPILFAAPYFPPPSMCLRRALAFR